MTRLTSHKKAEQKRVAAVCQQLSSEIKNAAREQIMGHRIAQAARDHETTRAWFIVPAMAGILSAQAGIAGLSLYDHEGCARVLSNHFHHDDVTTMLGEAVSLARMLIDVKAQETVQ